MAREIEPTDAGWGDLEDIEEDDPDAIQLPLFMAGITKVERELGVLDKDPVTWRVFIEIAGHADVIALKNQEFISTHQIFNNTFWSKYGKFIPYQMTRKAEKGKPNKWKKFCNYCYNQAETVQPSESTPWMECDILLSKLALRQVIEDKTRWGNVGMAETSLLKMNYQGEFYYCVKGSDIKELMEDFKLKTSLTDMSQICVKRGFKRKNNATIRVGTGGVWAWWFKVEAIEGLRINEKCENSTLKEESSY
jgi:hypothetical protein